MRKICRRFAILLASIAVVALMCPSVTWASDLHEAGSSAASLKVGTQAKSSPYAYETALKVNKAALSYMTDMYIKEHPEMGTEIMFGSPKDNATLSRLSRLITENAGTPAAKCKAIASWTKGNIRYKKDTTVFPIDVLEERQSDCMGYAFFMQQLMRDRGVPAVVCIGHRGDMKGTITLRNIRQKLLEDNDIYVGHAWVFAYYGGAWHLFDPLFDVYGETSESAIASWYIVENMEGVTPYYEGMDLNLITECFSFCTDEVTPGCGICRVGGKMMYFHDGKIDWGNKTNVSALFMDFEGGLMFSSRIHNENDDCSYVGNPSRLAATSKGEAFTDGLVSYGDMIYWYVRPNGIVVNCTFRQLFGKEAYLSGGGEPFRLSRSGSSISMTEGKPLVVRGSSLKLSTLWKVTDEKAAEGAFACWYTEDYETSKVNSSKKLGSVDQNGIFTAKGESRGPIAVCCTEFDHHDDGLDYHMRSCWANSICELYVSDNEKKVSFVSSITSGDISVAKQTYTGKSLTPQPIVRIGCKTLTKNSDYTLSYSNNVNAGIATVTVTGRGNYMGVAKATFRIVKATQKISAKNCKATAKAKRSGKLKALAKNVTVNLKKKARVSAKTKVVYKKANKAGGKKIAVNKKTGKVTLKKGLKKGTYKVKVKLTAPASKNYRAAKAKTITLKVTIK